jgi:DNA-binding FadR family transcriptional regulator
MDPEVAALHTFYRAVSEAVGNPYIKRTIKQQYALMLSALRTYETTTRRPLTTPLVTEGDAWA